MNVIDKMDLFPFMSEFFNKKGDWDRITDKVKKQHSFMIHRTLGIKFPEQMQALNKSHSVEIMDALHNSFSYDQTKRDQNGRMPPKQPSWTYTKIQRFKKEVDNLKGISDEVMMLYMKKHNLEYKHFIIALDQHTEKVSKELKKLQKIWEQKMTKPKKK